uniref:Cathepsin propeptide inhibitor domain-containing protein n=1 Tax=Oryza meridionalis TaxID=40149 RepID=A0A0E0D360_9ORYZ
MGRGSTVALAAATAALLVSLPMLLVSLLMLDTYEQETRRMFVEWKARYRKTYRYVGEEECRYAVFKESRRRVARARAAGPTSSGLNGLSAVASEEIYHGHGVQMGQELFEQETRRMFVGWKAKYGKTYRDVGEENCRYRLFMGNRRVVIRLNTAAGQNVYDLNQFGDLTNGEVQERCYPEMEDPELSARCQAAVPIPDPGSEPIHGRLIRYQVCRCIATELKQS